MHANAPTGRKKSGTFSGRDSSTDQLTDLDPATSPEADLVGEHIRVTRPKATLAGCITRVEDPAGGKDRRITFLVETEVGTRAVWAFPERDRDDIEFIDGATASDQA